MEAHKRNLSFLRTSPISRPTMFLALRVVSAVAAAAQPQHRGRAEHSATAARRLVDTSPGTEESADDYDDDEDDEPTMVVVATPENDAVDASTAGNDAQLSSASDQHQQGEELCTPVGECEMCHHNWRVMMEKEDEKIKGEYEGCVTYGRRRKFECTVLLQEKDFSKKIARSIPEYRSCRYTDGDEQLRMVRMQIICLLLGIWSLRNVRRLKVVSASLFDLRRMIQGSANGVSTPKPNVKFMPLGNKNSMESVELTQNTRQGKVPKSPAPDNMSMV